MAGPQLASLGSIRSNETLGFLKSCMDPKSFSVRPASFLSPAGAPQLVNVNGNFTVVPDQIPSTLNEAVSTAEGAIVWFPMGNVGAITHYGFVQSGTQRAAGAAWNGLMSQDPCSYATYCTFTKALAVPYLEDKYRINISPDLGKDYSASRCYSGYVTAYSNTVPTGLANLNGVFTTAVLSSTIGVAQSADGKGCYTPNELATYARTKKEAEGAKEVQASDGVVTIQGCDVDDKYRPPDWWNVSTMDGGWESFRYPSLDSLTYGSAVRGDTIDTSNIAANNVCRCIVSGLISPWGLEATNITTGFLSGLPYINFVSQQIPETGFLDFQFQLPLCWTWDSAPSLAGSEGINFTAGGELILKVDWIFAGIASAATGTLQYQSISRVQSQRFTYQGAQQVTSVDGQQYSTVGLAGGNVIVSTGSAWSCQDEFAARGGTNVLGKFIGVRYSVVAVQVHGTDPGDTGSLGTGIAGHWGIQKPAFTGTNTIGVAYALRCRASEIYTQGKVGPVHVIHYQGLSAGQNIRVEGGLNTENISKISTSQFTQVSISNSRLASDVNVYPLLYALFNGPITDFRMSWKRSEYARARAVLGQTMSVGRLIRVASAHSDRPTIVAAHAAGLFGDIGHALGSVAGSLLGNSAIGGAIGGAAGSLADKVFHAEGMFGEGGDDEDAYEANAFGMFGVDR